MLTSTPTSDGVIPVPPGPHSWLWKLEEVTDWPAIIAKHKALGFAGAHAHASGPVLRRVLTTALRHRWEDAGLHFGASIALDTGTKVRGADGKVVAFTPTAKEVLRDHVLRCAALLGPGSTVGLNWEMAWERTALHPARRDDAAWLAEALTRELAGSGTLLWDAPWWKPSVHGTAPTDEFGAAMAFRVPQTYFTYTFKDPATGKIVARQLTVPTTFSSRYPFSPCTPAAYMVGTSRAQYAARAVKRPLAWGFQACDVAGAAAKNGQCLRDYPVTFWWHFLRLYEPANTAARAVFRVGALAQAAFPGLPYRNAVAAFQTEARLTPDAWVGPASVAAARTRFGAAMNGY